MADWPLLYTLHFILILILNTMPLSTWQVEPDLPEFLKKVIIRHRLAIRLQWACQSLGVLMTRS